MSGRFPFYPEHIPGELKDDDAWVCCDEEKVPHIPLATGRLRRASSTDPETWRSYEQAEAAFATGRYWGIGRVIMVQDPYVGVDLDGCRDPETRRIAPWAWSIAERLNSYAEVSPSLTGIKIWVRAKLAHSQKRAGLEIYRGAQYFTSTGMFLAQFPLTVEPRQAELEAIVAEEFPPREKPNPGPYDGPREALDLGEILENTGVSVIAERQDQTAFLKYQISCPWISEHTKAPETGTYVGQYEDGALFFKCHHVHCSLRGWSEFREKVEPKGFNGRRRSKIYAARERVIGVA
jgi:hypothetical protein